MHAPLGFISRSLRPAKLIPEPQITSSPVHVILSQFDVSAKGRPWPIANTFDKFMLDRIDVGVINTALEIGFVSARMFKKAPLPDRQLVSLTTRLRNLWRIDHEWPKGSAEHGFDLSPTSTVIRVTVRKFPHRMKMIGQQRNRNDFKRPSRSYTPECTSETSSSV